MSVPHGLGRMHCLTEKIRTPFGPVFLHLDYDASGERSVGISQAQKFDDTTIGRRLGFIVRKLNTAISGTED